MLPLNGKPLVVNIIEKAIKSLQFDEIIVSTEDDEIANISNITGASVPFLRPELLSKDPSTLIDVMLHALEFYQKNGVQFDSICVLLPTSPFVSIQDIIEAKKIFDKSSKYSVMSVCPTEFPPFNSWVINEKNGIEQLQACFPNSKYKFTKSTECPKTFRSNGAILITQVDSLLKHRTYRVNSILPYVMPSERSLDIDTYFDYELAKFIVSTPIENIKSKR
tara:strand:+ start:83586 stop:84248 length:663 start_codon:yes stop_codon:yes gene_type:complete